MEQCMSRLADPLEQALQLALEQLHALQVASTGTEVFYRGMSELRASTEMEE